MKKLFFIFICSVILMSEFCYAASSEDVFTGIYRKKKTSNTSSSIFSLKKEKPQIPWFKVYLSDNKILEGVELTGGFKKNQFTFITNYESKIALPLKYIKYINFSDIPAELLEKEFESLDTSRLIMINNDIISGNILGFSKKEVKIETIYGKLNILNSGIKYVIFNKSGINMPLSEDDLNNTDATENKEENMQTEGGVE